MIESRFWRAFAATAALLLVVGLHVGLYLSGYGRFLLLAWLIVCVATLMAIGIATPIALYRYRGPDGHAILQLDPREGAIDLRCELLSPEEYADVTYAWGEPEQPAGTKLPVDVVVWYDPDERVAVGTHWSGLSPRMMIAYAHKVDEMYRKLEEESVKATRLESLVRTAARRGAQEIETDHWDTLDRETTPGDGNLGDVLDELLEVSRSDVDGAGAEDDPDESEDVDDDRVDDPEEGPRPALPDAEKEAGADD